MAHPISSDTERSLKKKAIDRDTGTKKYASRPKKGVFCWKNAFQGHSSCLNMKMKILFWKKVSYALFRSCTLLLNAKGTC